MTEGLPSVQQRRRLEITEDSLPPSASGQPLAAAQAAPAAPLPAPAAVAMPAPLPAAKQPLLPNASSFCHACGGSVDPRAPVCPRCGVPQHRAATSAALTAAALTMNSKSGGTAVILSLLFTGAGQWYCGRVGRGFAFFGAQVVSALLCLVIVGFVLLPVVWVWAAIDANKCAVQHNARMLAAVAGT